MQGIIRVFLKNIHILLYEGKYDDMLPSTAIAECGVNKYGIMI